MQAIPGLGNLDNLLSDFVNDPSSIEKFINELVQATTGELNEQMKDVLREDLLERAKASGGGVTDRERALIEKALDGTITKEEAEELTTALGPPPGTPQLPSQNPNGFQNKTISELVDMVGQALSVNSAMAADELRRRAGLDGYVGAELNDLLNRARMHGALTDAEQTRLLQLMSTEDAL
jgi:hypothetical protein